MSAARTSAPSHPSQHWVVWWSASFHSVPAKFVWTSTGFRWILFFNWVIGSGMAMGEMFPGFAASVQKLTGIIRKNTRQLRGKSWAYLKWWNWVDVTTPRAWPGSPASKQRILSLQRLTVRRMWDLNQQVVISKFNTGVSVRKIKSYPVPVTSCWTLPG